MPRFTEPKGYATWETAYIPKTGIPGWRRNFYDQAYVSARDKRPDLGFLDWLRQALDAAASEELNCEILPPPRAKKKKKKAKA